MFILHKGKDGVTSIEQDGWETKDSMRMSDLMRDLLSLSCLLIIKAYINLML